MLVDTVDGSMIAAVTADASPVIMDAEIITPQQGESAWIPCSTTIQKLDGAKVPTAQAIEVETNLVSTVSAIAGLWDKEQGMLLVSNFAQPSA